MKKTSVPKLGIERYHKECYMDRLTLIVSSHAVET